MPIFYFSGTDFAPMVGQVREIDNGKVEHRMGHLVG